METRSEGLGKISDIPNQIHAEVQLLLLLAPEVDKDPVSSSARFQNRMWRPFFPDWIS